MASSFIMRSMALGCGGGCVGCALAPGSSYILMGKHRNLNSKDVAEPGWNKILLCKVALIFSILSSC